VYFVVRAVRCAVVRWFIPFQSGFIPFHVGFIPLRKRFIPLRKWFIPLRTAFIPFRPFYSKIKDPEKYLGLNFFLFNLAISVNFGAGF
jgi:hypothetical protein